MKKMILIVFVVSLVALIASFSSGEKKSTPDTQIGLSKVSVFDSPAPEATKLNPVEPGDGKLVEKGFPEQPPEIPHGIFDVAAITFTENECFDCHDVEEKEPGEPTPVPESHYVDLRRAPEVVGDKLVGARYNCLSCHVSPGLNEPLVGNVFGE